MRRAAAETAFPDSGMVVAIRVRTGVACVLVHRIVTVYMHTRAWGTRVYTPLRTARVQGARAVLRGPQVHIALHAAIRPRTQSMHTSESHKDTLHCRQWYKLLWLDFSLKWMVLTRAI